MNHFRRDAPLSVVSPANFYSVDDLAIISDIKTYIADPTFPCVGAKAALAQGNVNFRIYDSIADASATTSLHFDLMEYVQTIDLNGPQIQSFAAIFKHSVDGGEEAFETRLWTQLSMLYEQSKGLQIDWNKEVSPDPDSPHFSMSIAGHPFFVVGMHGQASREARRTPYPTLVFNSNLQFDRLRADGRYDKLKAIIRQREIKFNGSVNPMLDDHGRTSEARQYSGRNLPADWVCPFHAKADAGKISK
ncbi:guanitoxin biosynthesis heme-dependent pre-guanitoxin N-hydroxylase GntA [Robiginitomaculum antarcticum]|uniref:guanitoxin biosynthesis heme-dependent pre-guanitoxin N-hydroxylase GntA n=1 Tax=Robiginitomaculum antarcticum TaxID=437507 RepID=UPI000382E9D1|nr:guanitoxin biosynthesis heme-dependent pre-guanitoxin N-hydroxylase GntA [Robiginitomaculum antarcticum]